ncbi:ring-h2 finger protein atl2 [Quercus suber]|uniref:RING-type E3 ubiquitin transferase n=1 Tax=Quercus suber TaxID=58331 RepID=A0AAW0JIE0_QUESU
MIIAFIFYYIAIFGLCAYKHLLHPPTTGEPVKEKTFDSLRMNPFLVSTFKYKKGTENIEAASETECVVCLTSFEDYEHVSQLPQCKQSFHAPCIDMWLYSHSDCLLCRTLIDRLSSQNGAMKSKQNFPDVTLPLPSKPHFSPRFFSIVYFQFFSHVYYNIKTFFFFFFFFFLFTHHFSKISTLDYLFYILLYLNNHFLYLFFLSLFFSDTFLCFLSKKTTQHKITINPNPQINPQIQLSPLSSRHQYQLFTQYPTHPPKPLTTNQTTPTTAR